jgi:hypothetical protein
MTAHQYLDLKAEIIRRGYAHEVDWAENVKPVADPDTFWMEYAWVVLNSGMKNTVASGIWEKVRRAVEAGQSASTVFGHKGKAGAIDEVFRRRVELLAEYQAAAAPLAFLESLPWIGPITKYHLAKNFGHDCAKPDRHLVRIAGSEQAAHDLCAFLARQIGDRIATVDLVIWRAASIGLV